MEAAWCRQWEVGLALDVTPEADLARPPGVVPAEHEWAPPAKPCCEAGRTERARCTRVRGSQSLQDPLWCCWAALHKRCSREAWLLVMTEG